MLFTLFTTLFCLALGNPTSARDCTACVRVENMTITVSTDGSALGNPNGPMGWAWADHEQNAGGKPGHKHDDHGYDAGGATNGTNQIGDDHGASGPAIAHRIGFRRRDQRHQPDQRTVRSVSWKLCERIEGWQSLHGSHCSSNRIAATEYANQLLDQVGQRLEEEPRWKNSRKNQPMKNKRASKSGDGRRNLTNAPFRWRHDGSGHENEGNELDTMNWLIRVRRFRSVRATAIYRLKAGSRRMR